MSAERFSPRTRPRRSSRGTGDRLREAVLALAAQRGHVLEHDEKAWASITFAGTRHRLVLTFTGAEAVAAGETFLAELPEHEFAIPGQLVADAAVVEVEHRLLPGENMVVHCEFLLLEES